MNIDYDYTIRFFETDVDGYGKHEVISYADVPAVFEQQTGFSHNGFQDSISSDAVALVDPNNEFVIANKNRLEEFLVVVNPYGADEQQSWYKIMSTTIGTYHQTSGEINTIQIMLNKTRPLNYVS